MNALARVLFQVGSFDLHQTRREALLRIGDAQVTRAADRFVKLTDLIAFGKIRIEIVFAVPLGVPSDLAVQGQAGSDRQFESPLVDDR